MRHEDQAITLNKLRNEFTSREKDVKVFSTYSLDITVI